MTGSAAVFFVDPIGQIRRFVVQKNAAIFHRRRTLHKFPGFHEKFVVMLAGTSAQKYHGETPICSDKS